MMFATQIRHMGCAVAPPRDAATKARVDRALHLSQLAYVAPKDIDSYIEASNLPVCYEACQPFSNKHAHAHVWRFDTTNELYIAFRGSATRHDLQQALNCHKAKLYLPHHPEYKDLFVHGGHIENFTCLQGLIEQDLTRRIASDRKIDKITMVGHSKGEVTASIAALYFGSLLKDISPQTQVSCIGFGGPKCAGGEDLRAAREACVSEYIHIVNEDDIIPVLPPSSFGFRHLGECWWLYDGKVYVKTEDRDDQRVADQSHILAWYITRNRKMIDDHFMDAYARNIQAWL